jgi:hypothetical protein
MWRQCGGSYAHQVLKRPASRADCTPH